MLYTGWYATLSAIGPASRDPVWGFYYPSNVILLPINSVLNKSVFCKLDI